MRAAAIPPDVELRRSRAKLKAFAGRIQLRPITKQQHLIPGLEFFVAAGIDDVRTAPFNANDADARARAEFEFANEFTRSRRVLGNADRFQIRLAQYGLQRGGGTFRPRRRRLRERFLQRDLSLE